jgi:hypothetical protein
MVMVSASLREKIRYSATAWVYCCERPTCCIGLLLNGEMRPRRERIPVRVVCKVPPSPC